MHLSFKRVLSICLSLVILLGVASCRDQTQEEKLEAFTTAVTEENYSLAADLYTEAQARKGFAEAEWVAVLDGKVSEIRRGYQIGNLNYDRTVLSLRALELKPTLAELVRPALDEAERDLAQGEAVNEELERAQIFAEAGDYRQSLAKYRDILEQFPDHAQARTEEAAVLGAYTAESDKQAEELVKEGYPRAALALVEQALTYDEGNQALINRKAEIESAIIEKDNSIEAEIPRYELGLLLEDGDLKGAESYLKALDEQGIDTTLLRPMLDEQIDSYITAVLESARALANEALEGRWAQNPYSRTIAKLNEGLALYPDNAQLKEAKQSYQQQVPENVAEDITIVRGDAVIGATGTDARGYTYREDGFDKALQVKPDTVFSYRMDGHRQTRLIISPKTADTNVYRNMIIRIAVGDDVIYDNVPFEESLATLDQLLEVGGSQTVTVTVLQSGFASFFDGILGRNALFIELYRLN